MSHATACHFVEVEGKAGLFFLESGHFGEVTVSAEEDGGTAITLLEKLEEAVSFVGHVGPFFEAMIGGHDLDGADKHAQISGLFEFCREPSPLGGTEHRGVRSGGGDVSVSSVDPFLLEPAAEETGIEEDELGPFAFGPHHSGMINAGGFSSRVTGGKIECIEKDLL